MLVCVVDTKSANQSRSREPGFKPPLKNSIGNSPRNKSLKIEQCECGAFPNISKGNLWCRHNEGTPADPWLSSGIHSLNRMQGGRFTGHCISPFTHPAVIPATPVERFSLSDMGLGTKNRQNQTADLCKEHLRTTHVAQGILVEDFILEIEGSGKAKDILKWGQFTDMSHDIGAMKERLDEQFTKWLNGDV
jgi:hypothetical protein